MNKIFYLLFSFLLVTTLALLNIKTIPAQAQTQECTYSCPMYHFEWQTKQCPANYTHVSQQHPGYCYKGGNPDWPEDYKIMDTVNHSADVVYEKSNDPHKCHRPSDNMLRDIYGMDNSVRGIFKADHSEWVDSIEDPGSCPTATPTPINTPECTPTPTDTPSCTPTPTNTPLPTPTPTEEHECDHECDHDCDQDCPPRPTCTPTPTCSPEPEVTPTPEMSGTPAPTVTPVPSAGGGSVGGNNNPGGPKVCSDEKPATPLLVSLTRNGKSMTLTWNRSDKANNYAIEYGITPGNYIYGFVGVGDLTQYTVNDLDPNQTYYAVVRAMNGCAMGDPSNELPKGGIGGGEVLGASTLAGTGTAAESLAWYAIAIGSLLVTASAYGYRFKKA